MGNKHTGINRHSFKWRKAKQIIKNTVEKKKKLKAIYDDTAIGTRQFK